MLLVSRAIFNGVAPLAPGSSTRSVFLPRYAGDPSRSRAIVVPIPCNRVLYGLDVASPRNLMLWNGVAAARALVERAVAGGEVDHVIAHTLPGPNPSTGVLVSLGLKHVDDQEDPEAGAVWDGLGCRKRRPHDLRHTAA